MLINERQREAAAKTASALESCDWSDVPLGQKMIVIQAIAFLRAASAAPAEGREALAWRVEWDRGGQTWVRTYTNERDAVDDGQAFSGTVTPLYPIATAPTMSEADSKDAARYRFLRSQMQVSAVQTQLPLYRVLHWHGFEDCNDVRHADEAIDAEIERIDRAAAKGEST